MTILRNPLRSTTRPPLRGALESRFGGTVELALSAQSADMGALTLTAAGAFPPVVNFTPTTPTYTIESGDASSHFQINSTTGAITPTAAGNTAGLSGSPYTLGTQLVCDEGTFTADVTVTAEPDVFSVINSTEVLAALTANSDTAGRTIKCRGGNYVETTIEDYSLTNQITITSHDINDKPIFARINVDNSDNIRLYRIELYNDTIINSTGLISFSNNPVNPVVEECEIHGIKYDYDADYTSSAYPGNSEGIDTSGSTTVDNLIAINNTLYDLAGGIVIGVLSGNCDISGNELKYIYVDMIKLGRVDNFGTYTRVNDNVGNQALSLGTDVNNPHTDCIQFLGSGLTADWTGIEVLRNRFFIGSTRGDFQLVFADDNVGTFMDGMRVAGNVLVTRAQAAGITITYAKDCEVIGNTVVKTEPLSGEGNTVSINLGSQSTSGTHKIWNNIAEAIPAIGTQNLKGNVILGEDGDTIAYTTVFDGPTFEPDTLAELMSKYDASSYGLGEAGPIGTGYVTFSSVSPGQTGVSIDTDFEAPTLSSVVGAETSATEADVDITTDDHTGTAYWFVSTSATPPNSTDLKAGTGAADNGSFSVTATGAQATQGATGLTSETTYYIHAIHTNSDALDSDILTSASFTTDVGATVDDMISSLTVQANGWELHGTILNAKDGGTYSGLNDKATPGMYLTVSSKSWDTAGVETTISRQIYATSVMRQPFPNGTLLEEAESGSDVNVKWSLSSRVFSGDTITEAVIAAGFFTDDGTGGSSVANSGGTNAATNSSTLAYYEPQAAWITPDKERIDSASWKPRLFVMHRYAQQGQPVRAVKFTATDESANSVTSTVSALTTGSFSASGLHANWYQPAWTTLDNLVDGDVVTIDVTIYPWVGDSYTLSTDAETYPSPYLSTLKAVCDAGGTFGTVYASVDGVGGGTPAASTSSVTADANPYASINAAVDAAITLNNSTNSRNNTSGVQIRILASTDIVNLGADTLDTKSAGDLPLELVGINQSTSTFETGSGTNEDIPTEMKISNLTIKRPAGGGTSGIGLRGTNLAASLLVFEDCTFDLNGEGVYDAWIFKTGRTYFVNCDGDYAGQGNSLATHYKEVISIGSTFHCETVAHAIANDVVSSASKDVFTCDATSLYGEPQGPCVAFNRANAISSSVNGVASSVADNGSRGICAVGNIFEASNAQNAPLSNLSSDSSVIPVINGISAMNTLAGNRINIGYQDVGTVEVLKDFVSKHEIHLEFNSKSDYFGTGSSNRVGNWAVRHGVDCGYSFIDEGDSSGETAPSHTAWLGEALGDAKNENPVGNVVTGLVDFTNDNSTTGSDDGGGDYSLGASTDVPSIPATETMFAVDLFGTAIPTNGTAFAGAVQ